jgi:hypothetical protein
VTTAPETFLGVAVPEQLKSQWRTWEAAAWRQQQYRNTNRMYPPDERFNVSPPNGMCETHRQMWLDYRNMHFDPRTGNRWPGNPGSPFTIVGHDLGQVLDERRVEWDEKASDQMRQIERICLAGGSPQCTPREETAKVRILPTARAAWPVEILQLPQEAS